MSGSVTATFVFTDLVDSTALASRLGPEGAEDLRRTHFGLLRSAVAVAAGQEVKNLGDGLMVMFPSTSRALSCVVGMQQAIEHHNRSADEPLGVRIGVAAGDATEEDDDYFGEPVVQAARLCSAAEGGQILTTTLVQALAGRHAPQEFVPVGPMELKGLSEPVDVVEVAWEPAQAVAGTLALPGRLVGAAANTLFGFVGRAPELEALAESIMHAGASRQVTSAFLAGEAGIGKTALVGQAARAAHHAGAVVLFGHADEELGGAYRPWIEALTPLVRDGDPTWVEALRPALRAALARLVPEAAEDGQAGGQVADPDTERLLLVESVVELLASASRSAPVVLVLDDVHWIDTASLQLLRQLVISPVEASVTVVCTYRDTDLGRDDPLAALLADLHREQQVTRLALRGLGDDEVVDLIAAAAGHELDDPGVDLAHALRRETEGNPFFTGEMLRHLGETGGIVQGAHGRWQLSGDLASEGFPTSVRDVVGRRVARLGEHASRVLSLAAVIGRQFDLDLLTEVTDHDEDDLLDLLDAAVAAAVLVEGDAAGQYRFAHALVQHTLYGELSTTRRQRAHRRIGEALEAGHRGDDPAALAMLAQHWIAATRPTDLDKALDYATRAGDAARDALAPDDAIGWYRRALDLVEGQQPVDEQARARLLARLGTALRQVADPEFRAVILDAAAIAQRLGDTETLVQAALGLSQSFTGMVADEESRPVIEGALDQLGAEPTSERARLLVALLDTYDAADDWQVRRDLAVEAVDIAGGLGEEATFVRVLDKAVYQLATPERREALIADIERSVTMATRTGDPLLGIRSRTHLLWARYQQADLAGVDGVIAELEALVDQVGLPKERMLLLQAVAARVLMAGQTAEAEALNDEALAVASTLDVPEAMGAYGAILSRIRQMQGRSIELLDFLVELQREMPSIGALRSGVILMLTDLGRLDEAQERLDTEAAEGFAYPEDGAWMSVMGNLLEAAASTGDEHAARVVIDRVGAYADHIIVPVISMEGAMARPLARAAAMLGEHDQAEQWFVVAHEIHHRLQAHFWTARGELDHADLCLARRAAGDVERARSLARSAAATAERDGYEALVLRAAALLDDA